MHAGLVGSASSTYQQSPLCGGPSPPDTISRFQAVRQQQNAHSHYCAAGFQPLPALREAIQIRSASLVLRTAPHALLAPPVPRDLPHQQNAPGTYTNVIGRSVCVPWREALFRMRGARPVQSVRRGNYCRRRQAPSCHVRLDATRAGRCYGQIAWPAARVLNRIDGITLCAPGTFTATGANRSAHAARAEAWTRAERRLVRHAAQAMPASGSSAELPCLPGLYFADRPHKLDLCRRVQPALRAPRLVAVPMLSRILLAHHITTVCSGAGKFQRIPARRSPIVRHPTTAGGQRAAVRLAATRAFPDR